MVVDACALEFWFVYVWVTGVRFCWREFLYWVCRCGFGVACKVIWVQWVYVGMVPEGWV